MLQYKSAISCGVHASAIPELTALVGLTLLSALNWSVAGTEIAPALAAVFACWMALHDLTCREDRFLVTDARVSHRAVERLTRGRNA